jgi:hypothetical protein
VCECVCVFSVWVCVSCEYFECVFVQCVSVCVLC